MAQSEQEEPILASDKLMDITIWIEYMQKQLLDECIDLVELSEIDRVHAIIKEQE